METKSLKIIKLEASNIKKLKAITITPDGKSVVVISGSNDSGKTSTLDAIAYALGGKSDICERPIRDGASKAKVVADLGEFKVTRSFSALGGSTLLIEDKSGSPVRSPQTLLDKLCSKIAFDPLAFVRMKPVEQLETLRKLVGLDFTALDAARKHAYDERTLVNRDLASAKARASEVEVNPETPDEEVSVSELLKEVSAIQTHNQQNAKKRADASAAAQRVALVEKEMLDKTAEITRLETQIAKLKDDNSQLAGIRSERKKEADLLAAEVVKLEDKDAAPVHAKIADAGSINAKVRDKKRFKQLQDEIAKTQKKSDELTAEIESFDKQKSDQLSAAKFPLPGLSFDETGVLLNGVPFTQGSQARQLQAAVAIGIAMNPTVRVILIRDGSLLDEKSLALVSQMAEEKDCQVWIEIVNSDDPAAIVIEDGEIVVPTE